MSHPTTDTMTHVAGPLVQVGRRVIQRCLICGWKMWDQDTVEAGDIVGWHEGAMVRTDDDGAHDTGDSMNDALPGDVCLPLVE